MNSSLVFHFLNIILKCLFKRKKKKTRSHVSESKRCRRVFRELSSFSSLHMLLLSRFSRVWLGATQWTAAHQAPSSLGFSRQEHWSGLPFPSPMHESEKWKWSRSVVSDSSWPHGLQPTRLLCPWDFPGKSTGVGCHYTCPSLKTTIVPLFLYIHFKRMVSASKHNEKCVCLFFFF